MRMCVLSSLRACRERPPLLPRRSSRRELTLLAHLAPTFRSQNGTKAARIALRQKFEAQGVNVFFIGALPLPRLETRRAVAVPDHRLMLLFVAQRTSATEKISSRPTFALSRSARPM